MAEYLCMVVPALVHLLVSTWLIEYVLTMQNVRQLLFLGWVWPHKTNFATDVYRSVPLIRPPILYTTFSLKWGEGLYSNMQLVSNISPPHPKKKFCAIATYTSKVHVYIRIVAKAFYTKQLIQTDTDREHCSWTSRLQSFVVFLHRRRGASSMRGQ